MIRRLEADTRQLLEETSRKLSSLTEQRRFRESRVNRDAPIPEPYPCAGYSSNGPDTVGKGFGAVFARKDAVGGIGGGHGGLWIRVKAD